MALKLKFRTLFPASVRATSPLTLVKTGIAYVFGLDINALRTSLDPIYVPNSAGNVVVANNIGFVADGVTPNDAAFAAWWEGVPAAGSCLEFGAGRYRFDAAIDKTMAAALQSVAIRGIGSDLTQLYWPAGGGLKITAGSSRNSVHIRDLSVVTGAAGVGTGLWLNSAQVLGTSVQSDVTNVQFRGDDFDDINANVHYWSTGISIFGWSIVHCFNINTYGKLPGSAGGGVGMRIAGVGGATGPVVGIYVKHSTFGWHVVGAQLNSNWEGVYFDTVNVVGQTGTVGIQNPNGLTHCGPLLSIFNSQFDGGGDQINLQSNVQQLCVVDCSITVSTASGTGIVNGGKDVIIQGSTFNTVGAGSTGIAYAGDRGTIAGNIFVDHATGINLTDATNVIVGPNTYSGVTTKVVPGVGNTVLDFGNGGTVVYQGDLFNNVLITEPASTSVLEIASGKHFSVFNTIALVGTDTRTYTFPTTSADVARTDAGQTFAGTQVFSSTITGSISGNAATATAATTATNSAIANDTTTNATMFPAWVTANTGNLPLKVTSSKLTFNPSTGALSSTSFTGAGTGLTGTAASLTVGDVANAPVIAKVLTGFASGAGTVSAADSILAALQKIDGNVALKAPLASAALTGTPTAPTASPGTNTTQLATTAYADAIAALKASIASPTFTGTPAAPTAAVDTNTTQIATTAMVLAQAASATPLINGTGSVGTSTRYARADHVHPTDTTRQALLTAGQLPGTATNDNGSAGNVGEYVSSTITAGSAVSLTSGVPANITSISLTSGDWDVTGLVAFGLGATTNVTFLSGSMSATSATSDTSMDRLLVNSFGTGQVIGAAGNNPRYPLSSSRFSLASTTTIFLVVNSGFTVSVNTAYGIIRARRAR